MDTATSSLTYRILLAIEWDTTHLQLQSITWEGENYTECILTTPPVEEKRNITIENNDIPKNTDRCEYFSGKCSKHDTIAIRKKVRRRYLGEGGRYTYKLQDTWICPSSSFWLKVCDTASASLGAEYSRNSESENTNL